MKKSLALALILSCTLLGGCGKDNMSAPVAPLTEYSSEAATESVDTGSAYEDIRYMNVMDTEVALEVEKEEIAALDDGITPDYSESVKRTEEVKEQSAEKPKKPEKPEKPKKTDIVGHQLAPSDYSVYNYVAIGNSVTVQDATQDIWNAKYGMAASSEENDYVHVVTKDIEKEFEVEAKLSTVSGKTWELADDRNSAFNFADTELDSDTKLVTIQLGENITENKDNLKSDYVNLFNHVKEEAPNAKVLVLSNVLWHFSDVDAAKKVAAEECGLTYLELKDFHDNYETLYKSSLDQVYHTVSGNPANITNEVVAAHPNDSGMKSIADEIMGGLK